MPLETRGSKNHEDENDLIYTPHGFKGKKYYFFSLYLTSTLTVNFRRKRLVSFCVAFATSVGCVLLDPFARCAWFLWVFSLFVRYWDSSLGSLLSDSISSPLWVRHFSGFGGFYCSSCCSFSFWRCVSVKCCSKLSFSSCGCCMWVIASNYYAATSLNYLGCPVILSILFFNQIRGDG